MKFEIKFSEIKKIQTPANPYVYLKFISGDNEKLAEIINQKGFKADKKLIEDFKKGNTKEIKFTPQENIYSEVILMKTDDNPGADYFRNVLSDIIISANEKTAYLIVDFPAKGEFIENVFGNFENYVQSIVEGILLGNYLFDKFKTEKKSPGKLHVQFFNDENKKVKEIIKKAEKIISAVNFARDTVNEPANVLTPQEFASRVKKLFKSGKVKVEIYDEAQLRKKNMNAILSVGKASENPPLLIKLSYKGKKVKDKIAFVGKGVTYDAGGLSIKPTSGMLDMKGDMAGAATVVGIMKAAESLALPYELYGIIPLAENMISGKSYKPGDIIHTSSGKTIEIGNTDAEGRLLLADALEFAEKLKPKKIFDFATLTGACLVALGQSYAGVFTENDELAESIAKASEQTAEFTWRLPLPEEYNELLKSDLADISNVGSTRWGGAITAALFLKFFLSEKTKKNWVHFDIAGPAFKHNQASYTKKYATGFGVRLIISLLENIEKKFNKD